MKDIIEVCAHCAFEVKNIKHREEDIYGNVWDMWDCPSCGGTNKVGTTAGSVVIIEDVVVDEAELLGHNVKEVLVQEVDAQEDSVLESGTVVLEVKEDVIEDDLYHCVIDVDGDGSVDRVSGHKSEDTCLAAGGKWIK